MKVIEFINEFEHRKENGYKIPERIKYNNHFYEYNGSYNNYYQEMSGGNVLHFSFEDLNDEIEIVEIIEDTSKKIKLDHFKSIEELKETVDNWIENDEIEWERWFSLYDLKTLVDKIIDLNQRINVTADYVENEMPYLEEPDEEFERCDGTTYMTMKEYDTSILLKKLKGEENV